jgi:hypothetical protein
MEQQNNKVVGPCPGSEQRPCGAEKPSRRKDSAKSVGLRIDPRRSRKELQIIQTEEYLQAGPVEGEGQCSRKSRKKCPNDAPVSLSWEARG